MDFTLCYQRLKLKLYKIHVKLQYSFLSAISNHVQTFVPSDLRGHDTEQRKATGNPAQMG